MVTVAWNRIDTDTGISIGASILITYKCKEANSEPQSGFG